MAYLGNKKNKPHRPSSPKRQAPPPPSPQEQASMVAFYPVVSVEELQHVPLGSRETYQKFIQNHGDTPLEKRTDFLKKAFGLAPNNPYTLFRVAFLYASQRDPRAKETMDRAMNLSKSLGVPIDKIERCLTRSP